jgi:hypothetical protein
MSNQDKPIVTIRIRKPAKMSRHGRSIIAAWMRSRADDLEAHGEEYADNFKYNYYPVQKAKS